LSINPHWNHGIKFSIKPHWIRLGVDATTFSYIIQGFAGVAQLVERNLAKVEVESSRLFSRSKFIGSFGFSLMVSGNGRLQG
jgi:hypothetical protein